MKRLGEHAIVIGASMGGLLAARALSDFYTAVTVLERDAFPGADTSRKGVPRVATPMGFLREAVRYSRNSSRAITTRSSRKAAGCSAIWPTL